MLEVERYELREAPWQSFGLDRRDFFRAFGAGAAVFVLLRAADAQESGRGQARRGGQQVPQDISSWIHIGDNGLVTAYTGKVEVGQNIRTSLTQVVAEELRCQPSSVELVMGDTDLTPYDMGTFGSRTTPTMAPQLRRAAAALRETIIATAAEAWHSDPQQVKLSNGQVTDGARAVKVGELLKGKTIAKAVQPDVPITPAADWKVEGQSLAKVNGRDFVTGKHQYTSDLRRPGMLYGKVVRTSAFHAKLASVDASAAKGVPGVVVVQDGDFIAVAAASGDAARKAAELVKAEWTASPQPSSKELFSYLKSHANAESKAPPIDDTLQQAEVKLESTYRIHYIAHVPLEPRSAVAEWDGDRLTVWTGTQRPFGVREELAEAFKIPQEQVRVIMPDTGSGYGGKHTGEAAIEAARLARAAKKPVKLTWSREEELTWAYFRPAGVIEIRSGASKDGRLTAWEFHNYNSGGSGIETPYDVAAKRIAFHEAESPLRQGSYRGLAATANHFARESHMDDMAHAVAMEPMEFRLKNLTNPRLRAVLTAAAERFGWGKTKGAVGLSCGMEKGGYAAACAEVAMRPNGQVQIVRVVEAFECGAVINPNQLKNQIEGSIAMAVGGALFEAVEFENGRVLTNHLAKYRVPRFTDMPAIDVVLVDRKDLPSAGAGETPIIALAPAVGNAIFPATGQRIRQMPMAPNGIAKS